MCQFEVFWFLTMQYHKKTSSPFEKFQKFSLALSLFHHKIKKLIKLIKIEISELLLSRSHACRGVAGVKQNFFGTFIFQFFSQSLIRNQFSAMETIISHCQFSIIVRLVSGKNAVRFLYTLCCFANEIFAKTKVPCDACEWIIFNFSFSRFYGVDSQSTSKFVVSRNLKFTKRP